MRLLWALIVRDIKVRFKQTIGSYAWGIANPILLMLVFTLFFGVLLEVPSYDVPYPVFVYTGLLPWTLFSAGLLRATNSLVSEPSLVSRVRIQRLLVPTAGVLSPLLDFVLALLVLVGMMFFYGIGLTWQVLWVVPVMGLLLLFGLGLGYWLSALQVQYRDVGWALPPFLQMAMFASPVVYASALVEGTGWQFLYALNPMATVIEGFRYALLGQSPTGDILLGAPVAAVVLASGYWFFRSREPMFADVV